MHRENSSNAELLELAELPCFGYRVSEEDRQRESERAILRRVSRPAFNYKHLADCLVEEHKLKGAKLYYWKAIRNFERIKGHHFLGQIEYCHNAISKLL